MSTAKLFAPAALKVNLVDLILLGFFALAVVDGARRGFAPYASEFVSLLLALVLAFACFRPLAALFELLDVPVPTAQIGSFLVLLILGHAAGLITARRSLTWSAEPARSMLRRLRALAPVPALATAVVVAAVVVSSLLALPQQPARTLILGSTIGATLAQHSSFVEPPLHSLLAPVAGSPGSIAGEPQTRGGQDFYRLHLPSHLQLVLDTGAENRMLELVNEARKRAGLPPLAMDPKLQQAARDHSRDMYARAYFSHLTPENRTPFDRISAAGVKYVTAGENIAFAPDVDQAEASLMESAEHRANILNPDFRRIGIGVYRAPGGYEEMFTQDFADAGPGAYSGD